jgi:thymidylate synthase
MYSYLNIVRNVLKNGKWKSNRTGVNTLTCANVVFSHEMSEGFPLLTTKKMPMQTIAVELEGFIKGVTSKKWFQDRKCHIWDEWANPTIVNEYYNYQLQSCLDLEETPETKLEVQRHEDDLGPIYGFQWRRFNQAYDEDDEGCITRYDQLKTIVDTLKSNPNDRRMVCSAWNPVQMDRMALPACHFTWGLTHINGILNLYWVQRSCDLMLGVPFNIASYALLLLLLCKESNLKPGNLTGLLADCHIYENHIDQAQEQLLRDPHDLPTITIPDNITLDDGSQKPYNIFDWTHKNYTLSNYYPHPHIKMEVAV